MLTFGTTGVPRWSVPYPARCPMNGEGGHMEFLKIGNAIKSLLAAVVATSGRPILTNYEPDKVKIAELKMRQG